MNEQQQAAGTFASNQAYLSQSALELRLETKEILEKIQCFLSGVTSVTLQDEQTGKLKVQTMKMGERLMNREGVGHIVNYVSSIINPATVQGNYTEEWWREQLERNHKRLAKIITVNTPSWDIKQNARESIIGFIMDLIIPFSSRLIDNKERESYAATIKTTESSSHVTQPPGLLNRVGIQ